MQFPIKNNATHGQKNRVLRSLQAALAPPYLAGWPSCFAFGFGFLLVFLWEAEPEAGPPAPLSLVLHAS
jgi:hypothetical protein